MSPTDAEPDEVKAVAADEAEIRERYLRRCDRA